MPRFRLLLVILSLMVPAQVWACACGCGLFDIGTSNSYSTSTGGMVFLEYNFLDQNQDRGGTSIAAASSNPDQEISTHFVTLGGQYTFNRDWGVRAEVPYWFRMLSTIPDGMSTAQVFDHASIGDIRLRGIYTGLLDDMSLGLTFGVKLPTGDSTYAGFDPDTEIGTGSTDLLLGAYRLGSFVKDSYWKWFTHVSLDQPLLTQNGYTPGNEIDMAFGAYYSGLLITNYSVIMPMFQILGALRGADEGTGDPVNSGYQRILISPGIEATFSNLKIYGDVEFPVYQDFNGFQLAASVAYKTVVSYSF